MKLTDWAAERLGAIFPAIDVAKTASGEWIIIEVNDAQESGHMPESVPTPVGGEYLTDRHKTTYRLRTFFGEHQTELLHVHRQDVPSVLDTGRDSLPERVVFMLELEDVPLQCHAHQSLVADEHTRLL